VCSCGLGNLCAMCSESFPVKSHFWPSHFVDEVCVCAHCIISAMVHGNASSTWGFGQFMSVEWVRMEQLVGRRDESGRELCFDLD
jgi:hypothetical protein